MRIPTVARSTEQIIGLRRAVSCMNNQRACKDKGVSISTWRCESALIFASSLPFMSASFPSTSSPRIPCAPPVLCVGGVQHPLREQELRVVDLAGRGETARRGRLWRAVLRVAWFLCVCCAVLSRSCFHILASPYVYALVLHI